MGGGGRPPTPSPSIPSTGDHPPPLFLSQEGVYPPPICDRNRGVTPPPLWPGPAHSHVPKKNCDQKSFVEDSTRTNPGFQCKNTGHPKSGEGGRPPTPSPSIPSTGDHPPTPLLSQEGAYPPTLWDCGGGTPCCKQTVKPVYRIMQLQKSENFIPSSQALRPQVPVPSSLARPLSPLRSRPALSSHQDTGYP